MSEATTSWAHDVTLIYVLQLSLTLMIFGYVFSAQ